MIRTVLAITGNWLINSAFVLATGAYTPWLWFACIDAITAAIILARPAGKWQAAIGWVFIAQIVVHFMYWIADRPEAAYDYWLMLTRLAWLQIALVVLWGGIMGGKRSYSAWVRRRSGNAVADGVGSVAG